MQDGGLCDIFLFLYIRISRVEGALYSAPPHRNPKASPLFLGLIQLKVPKPWKTKKEILPPGQSQTWATHCTVGTPSFFVGRKGPLHGATMKILSSLPDVKANSRGPLNRVFSKPSSCPAEIFGAIFELSLPILYPLPSLMLRRAVPFEYHGVFSKSRNYSPN